MMCLSEWMFDLSMTQLKRILQLLVLVKTRFGQAHEVEKES